MARKDTRQAVRERLEADLLAGRLAALPAYQQIFPGEEALVEEEYRRIRADWAGAHEPTRIDIHDSVATETAAGGDAPSGVSELPGLTHMAPFAWDRYEIGAEIGRGGMGAVVELRDLSLDRLLAMKIIKPPATGGSEIPTPSATQAKRFLTEARVTAQLDHPGIVPVHEVGLVSPDNLYFTMKRVQGRPLSDILRELEEGDSGSAARGDEGEWNLPRVLELLVRMSETVAFAHSRGVIHRDLKPSNIMVGSFGQVYVMDWGLAKVLGQTEETHPEESTSGAAGLPLAGGADALTMEGAVMGSPPYMSPEQAAGDLDRIGPASDVYSLGSILYRVLAGHAPFTGHGSRFSGDEIIAAVRDRAPDPIGLAAPTRPAELIAICEKAMAREPSDRYKSANDLAADLRSYLEGRVVRAHRTGPIPELRKWIQRNRPLATAVVAVVLVLVVGTFGYARLQQEATRNAEEALATEKTLREATDDAMLEVQEARNRSEGLRLAALSQSVRAQSATLGVLLGLEAMTRAPGLASRQALIDALGSLHECTYLGPHGEYVTAAQWLDGGRTIVTRTRAGALHLWSAADGMEGQITPLDDDDPALALAAARGAPRFLALFAQGLTLRVYETASTPGGPRATEIASLELEGRGELHSLALTDDGERVVVFFGGGDFELRDATSMAIVRQASIGGDLLALGTSRDGSSFTTVSRTVCKRFDSRSGELLGEVALAGLLVSDVERLELDDSGRRLFAERVGPGIDVYDLETREHIFEDVEAARGAISPGGDVVFAQHPAATPEARDRQLLRFFELPGGDVLGEYRTDVGVRYVAFAPDGDTFAFVDGAVLDIHLLHTHSGLLAATLRGHIYDINAIEFSASGDQLISASRDRTARVWWTVPPDTRALLTPDEFRGGVTLGAISPKLDWYLRFRPDGGDPVGPSVSGTAELVETETGAPLRAVSRVACSSECSADGSVLFTWIWESMSELRFRIFDTRDLAAEPVEFTAEPGIVELNAAGTYLALGSRERREIEIRSAVDGAVVSRHTMELPFVGVDVSPDGKRFATADAMEKSVSIHRTSDGELLGRSGGHFGMAIDVAWSPDGTRVASTAVDGSVLIRDGETAEIVGTFRGFPMTENAVTWGLDGNRICVRMPFYSWVGDVREEAEVARSLQGERLARAGLSPDCEWLWTLDVLGTLRRMPLSPEEYARSRVPRPLDAGELSRYGIDEVRLSPRARSR